MQSLFIESGIEKLIMLIRRLRDDDDLGRLIQINLQWFQQLAGTSFSLLQHPGISTPYIDDDWFTNLREFLCEVNGSVVTTFIPKVLPKPLRVGDCVLMDTVLADGYKKSDLIAFNRVRIFFGVEMLAEICTANGTAIACDAWDGSSLRYTSNLWSYKPKPSEKIFKIWRKLLASTFLSNPPGRTTSTSKYLNIANPLKEGLPHSTWIFNKKKKKWQQNSDSNSDSDSVSDSDSDDPASNSVPNSALDLALFRIF